MMKRWILRWLGLIPKGSDIAAAVPSRGRLVDTPHRNYFEIIEATNGKIVVYTQNQYDPNGPDCNDMEIYLVHDGDNLLDTIKKALVTAKLKGWPSITQTRGISVIGLPP
jgi:hypothetical protein